MLELQSLQKEQQHRELLYKIQREDDCSMEITVPLRKGITNSVTNQPDDDLRLNNNHDTLHFDNDVNDDEIGTTVADDFILMKTEANNDLTLSRRNASENDRSSATITVRFRTINFQANL